MVSFVDITLGRTFLFRDLSMLLIISATASFIKLDYAQAYHRSVARLFYALRAGIVLDAFAVLLCALYAATIIASAVYPNYLDHIQALITSVAWLSFQGLPIHPSPVSGDLYGGIYGPVIYQAEALFLAISPTIAGSKLPGTIFPVVAACLQYLTFRKTSPALHDRFRLLAMTIIVLSNNTFFLTNRSDSFIVALVSFALYCLVAFEARIAAAAVGIAAGIALGMKFHAFLYFIPMAATLVVAQQARKMRIQCFLVGLAAAIAVSLLPFASANAEIAQYWSYLILASHHGFSDRALHENIALGTVLLAIPGSAYVLLRPKLPPSDLVLLASLAISLGPVVVIASKLGSGMNHLFPFAPTAFFGVARIVRLPSKARVTSEAVLQTLLASISATFGIVAVIENGAIIGTVADTYSQERQKLADLLQLFSQHRDAEMGVSDDVHYQDSALYPAMVLAGGGLKFDAAAWMDLKQGHVSDRYTLDLLSHCQVREWILPSRGKPFSLRSYYDNLPLLSDKFRADFHEKYYLGSHGRFYDLWSCKAGTPS